VFLYYEDRKLITGHDAGWILICIPPHEHLSMGANRKTRWMTSQIEWKT